MPICTDPHNYACSNMLFFTTGSCNTEYNIWLSIYLCIFCIIYSNLLLRWLCLTWARSLNHFSGDLKIQLWRGYIHHGFYDFQYLWTQTWLNVVNNYSQTPPDNQPFDWTIFCREVWNCAYMVVSCTCLRAKAFSVLSKNGWHF